MFPKAPKTNYNLLAPKLDSLGFDEVSIEDAEAMNDLSLLALFKNTKVVPLSTVTLVTPVMTGDHGQRGGGPQPGGDQGEGTGLHI